MFMNWFKNSPKNAAEVNHECAGSDDVPCPLTRVKPGENTDVETHSSVKGYIFTEKLKNLV